MAGRLVPQVWLNLKGRDGLVVKESKIIGEDFCLQRPGI